jgi:hypothetical protein
MRRSPLALRLGLVAGALAVGCLGGGTPPEFFALRPTHTVAGGVSAASGSGLGIAIGPIDIPRYLDRPEMVTRDGMHRLDVWDEHRWGGSLRTDILRVMSDDLGTLLGTTHVAVYPTEPLFRVDYRVLLDVLEFEGVLARSVILRARWTVVSAAVDRAPILEDFRVEQPVASPSWDDLAAAQSAALGALSGEIAAKIASLPAR